MALSRDETTAALRMLADTAAKRAADISKHSPSDEGIDEEPYSASPVFDSFYKNGGNASILSMTNFTSVEFEKVFGFLVGHINTKWNVARGKRCKYGSKDMLFMTLSVLKHAGQWDYMGNIFGIKGPTFERMVVSFVKIIAMYAYERFVKELTEKYTIEHLNEKGKQFGNYPYALYATDVTFQRTNRPSGNLQEAKLYYSGNHKLYGYKFEVSVLPNGLAKDCTAHVPGSIADIDLLIRNLQYHQDSLRKTDDEKNIFDEGLYFEKYPKSRALILDKGYQGTLEMLRAIHPKKKPRNGMLTTQEREDNRDVSVV